MIYVARRLNPLPLLLDLIERPERRQQAPSSAPPAARRALPDVGRLKAGPGAVARMDQNQP